jgi:hypothetical protein
MIDIAQGEFQQLISQDARDVCEAKERVVGENSPYAHRPRVQDSLVAEVTQAAVAMDYIDLLPD